MTTEEIFNRLVAQMATFFTDVERYINSQTEKGYLRFVSQKENYLEYKVGFSDLRLRAEISPLQRSSIFVTALFEEKNRPSEKIILLEELNILGDIVGNLKFSSPKKAVFGRYSAEIDVTEIQEAGKEYIDQVIFHINKGG